MCGTACVLRLLHVCMLAQESVRILAGSAGSVSGENKKLPCNANPRDVHHPWPGIRPGQSGAIKRHKSLLDCISPYGNAWPPPLPKGACPQGSFLVVGAVCPNQAIEMSLGLAS